MGQYTTCGVTTSGDAYCWGDGSYGLLGSGDYSNSSIPVLVAGGHSFAAVSIGSGGVTACGITVSGDAYCWGTGSSGQLGNGNYSFSPVPVAVAN